LTTVSASIPAPAPASTLEQQPTKLADAYAPELDDTTAVNKHSTVIEPLLGGVSPTAPAAPKPAGTANNLISHSYISNSPTYAAPINATEQPDDVSNVDIFASGSLQASAVPASPFAPPTVTDAIVAPSDNLAGVSQNMKSRDEVSRDEALAATHATFNASGQSSFTPTLGVTLPLPPPLPDFGALPQTNLSPAYAVDPIAQPPGRLGDILAPEATQQSPAQPSSTDPGQFKIPGQQS
jgi:hypothetical protein